MHALKKLSAAAALALASTAALAAEPKPLTQWLEHTFKDAVTPEGARPGTKFVEGHTLEGRQCALHFNTFAGQTYMMLGENFYYSYNSYGSSQLVGSTDKSVAMDYLGDEPIERPDFSYKPEIGKNKQTLKFSMQTHENIMTHFGGGQSEMRGYDFNKSMTFTLDASGGVTKIEAEDKLTKINTACYFSARVS